MIAPLILFAVITFTPQRPTVGDPITVNLPDAVTVQPGDGYEIVARRGNSVVVRTFEPKTFALHTSDGDVMIPVHSVLKPDDKLDPAPLVPPRPEPYPRAPFIAMGVAALAAALAWVGVFLLARRRVVQPVIRVDPAEGIRRARDWAELADAVRAYLAATDHRLGPELTTRELLARCHDPIVAEVLRQGDLQKFSPWGAAPGDFDALARRAQALIRPPAADEERAA
jgi:hypothetical protein